MSRSSARFLLFRLSFALLTSTAVMLAASSVPAGDTLELLPPKDAAGAKHIVLISGDEEYRSEETMPMLAKILARKHGFRCTVLFCFGPDGAAWIDPNNQKGLRGLEALQTADLMIIATRFRNPDAEQAAYITEYLNTGKPVIGLRTATHAFRGSNSFGEKLSYDDFGLKILGEQWVSHHGKHKVEGCRAVLEKGAGKHPILRGIRNIFVPSDVYGVRHLTKNDEILLRGAITKSLDPASPLLKDDRNNPMQPFAWLHPYQAPSGKRMGRSFCTTGGASVDFLSNDMRRMVVNAALFLTAQNVPPKSNVDFVDPYYPSFYGFIRSPDFYPDMNRRPEDFGWGKSPVAFDPEGTPDWPFRPRPPIAN
jgi:type 1 glutamine amidotransferase